MKKTSLIRTIYLYLFSMLGLVLLVIGCVRFVDMGLKTFIFTEADLEQRINYQRPPMYAANINDLKAIKDGENLKEVQAEKIERLIQDYENWEKRREEVDPIKSRRHRDSATNLALILVGLPLYLYHWKVVQKANLS